MFSYVFSVNGDIGGESYTMMHWNSLPEEESNPGGFSRKWAQMNDVKTSFKFNQLC